MNSINDFLEYFSNETDIAVKRSILKQILENPAYRKEFLKQKNLSALMAVKNELPDEEIDRLFMQLKERIDRKIQRNKNIKVWLRYAAVILAVSGLTLLLNNLLTINERKSQSVTTVISANGQQSTVILPDSSVVTLNYNSKLIYAENYGENNRRVQLEGEAYFDVKKQNNLEFTVQTSDIDIKVLGTRFNVQAYGNNEQTKVILETGSVQISDHANQFSHRMNPGQIVFYDTRTGNLRMDTINLSRALAWREGIIYFVDTPMPEVISQLERKYNIKIQVKNQNVLKTVFTATLKNESITDVLKLIEYSCLIRYKIENQSDMHAPTLIAFDIKRPVKNNN